MFGNSIAFDQLEVEQARRLELRSQKLRRYLDLATIANCFCTSGFKFVKCIFQFKGEESIQLICSDDDKTEYECFLNDVHIDEYLIDASDEFEYLQVDQNLAKGHDGLKLNFRTDFRIAVSYSETTYEGQEIGNYGGCVVKFYTTRN